MDLTNAYTRHPSTQGIGAFFDKGGGWGRPGDVVDDPLEGLDKEVNIDIPHPDDDDCEEPTPRPRGDRIGEHVD